MAVSVGCDGIQHSLLGQFGIKLPFSAGVFNDECFYFTKFITALLLYSMFIFCLFVFLNLV